MAKRSYLNFDVRIDAVRSGYRAWISEAPVGGEASVQFQLPPHVVQGRFPDNLPSARTYGGNLFETIFDAEVLTLLRRSQALAEDGEQGLRIRLSLAGAPELARLPWELLYDPAFDHFFALSGGTPLVRYLDLPREAQPLKLAMPLKVLVLISMPQGQPQLDVETEWARLNQALDELIQREYVALVRMEQATLADLQRRLRRDEYHVFHFLGHGAFDEAAQDGLLLLEDEAGNGHPVSGSYLGTLLHDHRTLQLAVLNACQGGAAGREDPFAGVAQTLVQRGIPAVVAMQRAITDKAAVLFSQEFYSALADGYPVDGALVEGRKAIYAAGNPVEWGTPVLFMRSPDGTLFDVQPHAKISSDPDAAQKAPISKVAPPETALQILDGVEPGKVVSDYAGEIQDLRAQLQRQRLALFIGADLPAAVTGLPSRRDLASELAAREGLSQVDGLPAVAQQVMSHSNRWVFTDFLQEALETVGKAPQPIHQAVVALVNTFGIETLITTAYDDLLEQAFRQNGIGLDVVISDEQLGFVRSDRPTLIKFHGDIRQATSLTVTEQDQNALIRGRVKRDIVDEVEHTIRRNSLLFLGFDLSDLSVAAWFDEVAGGRFQRTSYAIWSGLSARQVESYRGNRGLIVLDVDPVSLLAELVQ